MPIFITPRVPRYRHHKPSGQAVVTLDGRDIYLGTWNTTASRREYDRLTGEWLAAGRRLPTEADPVAVVELCAAYWRFAKGYYRKNGQPTRTIERVKLAIRHLRELYGPRPVVEFGPLALQALQQRFVREGKGRRYVNYLTEEIKRAFKWGVSQEMVPAAVYQALATVSGLRKGRTDAHESQSVQPAPAAAVDATLPHLPSVVADMIRFQRLTGCRPGEVCVLRPCNVDRKGDVWAYRPESHKTEHHGRERVIFIGPQAQKILRAYLLRAPDDYCFTPAESERKRLAARHAERRTPPGYGNRPGTNRKRRPKLLPGQRYETGQYANCVRRACDLADRKAHKADPSIEADNRLVPRWTPNQLRHSMATDVRQRYGLEAVQVVLGHATANVTQIYAERDLGLAARIMREVG